MAVFYALRYMDRVDYLTISGNFAATSERLLQFPCIVAVRKTSVLSEAKEKPCPFTFTKNMKSLGSQKLLRSGSI